MSQLLFLTFLESFATILTERATYFYTADRLGYPDTWNLLIALGLGLTYVFGATTSGFWTRRIRERTLLAITLVGQAVVHLMIWRWPSGSTLIGGLLMLGWLNGLKWPIIESFVSAGKTPNEAARAVGRFNVAWSSAVPLSLMAAGPFITYCPTGMFLLAAVLNVTALGLCFTQPQHPVHLPHDHPERPDPDTVYRLRGLLTSSRFSMLSSYSLLFLMSPLLPGVFARLGIPVLIATTLVALLDVLRVATFYLLSHWMGWHNRASLLVLVVIALPLGFFLILFGPTLLPVLAGEILFGVATGMSYYAALYYAMVVENASVDAGGAHEGMIGLGFAIGPSLGLAGIALAAPMGSALLGMTAGVAPVLLILMAGALRPLARMRVTRSG